MSQIINNQYGELVDQIGATLSEARATASHAINTILVHSYWNIGKHIVEFEQGGSAKAEYGRELVARLSKDLTLRYGKGFSHSNIIYMRMLYQNFPKSQTLSNFLSWSHYIEILKLDDPLEASFYIAQCETDRWSVRELKRQRNSMLFHRIALSRDKEGVLDLARKGVEIQAAEDIVKDPYVLEFLNLPDQGNYLESELEEEIIGNLQKFLMELGKGFTFVGRQYRISIEGHHFYVDLVFYHRILKCFVLIDLKRDDVKHTDIGQMNLYLNYFAAEENTDGDNAPIGIVLGATKNKVLIKYALENITNQLFVSKYQLYLPNEEQLRNQVQRLLDK